MPFTLELQEAKLAQESRSGAGVGISLDYWALGLLVLLGLLVRLWDIGGKGLWYDETLTAWISRATPAEIVQYHWRASFEHPPLWMLFMHAWSAVFGRSEAALRWPAAIAGALLIPITWQTLRTCRPNDRLLRLLAALFVALSPSLILYSQEARMYAFVTLFAMASIGLFLHSLRTTSLLTIALFVATNWLMMGFHYYSVLLILAEGLCLLAILPTCRWRTRRVAFALAISVLPLALWSAFSPGFRATVRIVLSQSTRTATTWLAFADRFWRELTFGSVVWIPPQAAVGYLLLPLLLLGLFASLRVENALFAMKRHPEIAASGRLFCLVFSAPVVASLAFPDRIFTRYILFVAPVFYILMASAVGFLWRRSRVLGGGATLAVLAVAILGLSHYFLTYQKSGYREMAAYVVSHSASGDMVLIEGPRQHLLAKYYFPADRRISPIPEVALPDYWPVTASRVIPEDADDYLRRILKEEGHFWLVFAGQAEVDPNGFVPRFLAAISFDVDCRELLDVRVCYYAEPDSLTADLSLVLDATFEKELQLSGVRLAHLAEVRDAQRFLLVALDWRAIAKPSVDYTVTLRLLDQHGKIQAQTDRLPIGQLLPPTTWIEGDDKPGYMTISLPEEIPPGEYDLVLGAYDPVSGALFEPMTSSGRLGDLLPIAKVQVDGSGIRSVLESDR